MFHSLRLSRIIDDVKIVDVNKTSIFLRDGMNVQVLLFPRYDRLIVETAIESPMWTCKARKQRFPNLYVGIWTNSGFPHSSNCSHRTADKYIVICGQMATLSIDRHNTM